LSICGGWKLWCGNLKLKWNKPGDDEDQWDSLSWGGYQ
jgi:hypothetical protein